MESTCKMDRVKPAPLFQTPDKINIIGGLPPFIRACRYYIHPKHQTPPFLRIECEDEDLSFLLVDPYMLECGYKPEFFDSDYEEIGMKPGGPAMVLAIVNLNRGIDLASCNLVGPLLLNPGNGRGKQVVLKNNTLYSSRHPLFKPKGPQC